MMRGEGLAHSYCIFTPSDLGYFFCCLILCTRGGVHFVYIIFLNNFLLVSQSSHMTYHFLCQFCGSTYINNS